MPLVFGGKRKPGGTGPRTPLDPLEQKVTDRVALVLRALANGVDVDAFAAAIRDLDPDALERLLADIQIGQIQQLLDDTLKNVVISGASEEARRILRSSPRINPVPGDALEYGGKVLPSGIVLPTSQAPAVPGIEFAIETPVDRMFTSINVRATDYARIRSAQLVTEVSNSNRLAIRRVISQAFTPPNPKTVDQTARTLRQIVGLHSRWATAVENFDAKNFRAFLKEGMSESAARARADVLTKRYRDKLIRRRAEMIARTELQMAGNFARQASWEASDRAGLVDPGSMKEWRTAPLGSSYGPPCDECQGLRGKRVPWNGTFPNGLLTPPAHPHCRCTVVLVPPTRGLTGLPSQNMDDWISRLDELEAEDAPVMLKHLPGQHDQSTHGRGGSHAPSHSVEGSKSDRVAAAALSGEPTGLTVEDMDEVRANPGAYGFKYTSVDDFLVPLGYSREEKEKLAVELQIKDAGNGFLRREARKDEAARTQDKWSTTRFENTRQFYEEFRSKGRVMVAADPEDANAILRDGKYKSLFETNTSNGARAYEARREEEFASHDLHPNLDPSKRPAYGYVVLGDSVGDLQDAVHGYGRVRIELKPDVKSRTTMTDGDSLGSPATPVPMTGERLTAFQVAGASLGWNSIGTGPMMEEIGHTPQEIFDSKPRGYIEAQIKEGFTVGDIARIHVMGSRPPATEATQQTSQLYIMESRAADLGIEVVYTVPDQGI